MTPQELVEFLKTHNDIGKVSPLVGFWGVADASDISNGNATSRSFTQTI